jgi:RHS repeat-associated protein
MTFHQARSALFGCALTSVVLLHSAAAYAVDSADCKLNNGTQYCEPKIYVWGGDQYGGTYIYPAFDDKAATLMPTERAATGPDAYPVYFFRDHGVFPNSCGSCNSPNDYTHQDVADGGYVAAERENQSPPAADRWVRHYSFVSAIYTCRGDLPATSGTNTNLCSSGRDKDKDVGPCPDCDAAQQGNPIHAGTGNKYQVEVDYVAGGSGGLELRRYYNSALTANSGIGAKWRTSYDRRVITLNTKAQAPAVMMRRQTGIGLVFTFWGGAWHASDDVSDSLTQLASGWQYYVAATEETETYNASGQLTAIQTRSGLVTTLTYSDASTPANIAPRAGLLIQVSDPFARQINFTWSKQELIASVTDPNSQVYSYAYDANANLTGVTYPDTTVRTYVYENTSCVNALTGIVDENGNRYSTYGYDSQCRATSTQLAGGAGLVSLSYGTGSTVVTDALNTARTLSFQVVTGVTRTTAITQPCSSCGGVPDAVISYDANGNVASRTDFNGNRTNHTYDLARNLETQRIEGLTSAGGTTAVTRTISTQWHATFRLPIQIAEPKRIATFAYDSQGNLTTKTIQATTDANGSQGFSAPPTGSPRTWTYTNTYSGSIPGLMIQQIVDGPRTNVSDLTTYVWDNSRNLISVTNALNQVTTLSNYDANGRPLTITDPNGLATTLSYDVRGRPTSRNVGGEITSYFYDNAGQLTQVTLPDGSYLAYTYDPAHRLIQIQDNLGNKIVYTLDAMGNRTQEQVFDPSTTLVQSRSRGYNNLNRLAQDIGGANPATEITNYAYDNQGNLTTILDPLGHTTSNVYDALNRLIKVIDPAASGSGSGGNTQYAYDGLDQLAQVTDPRSLATGYTIDGLGNLTTQVSPDTGTTSATFDTAGNTITRTDARGAGATFTFDGLNRMTQAAYGAVPGGLGYQSTRTYSYDQGSFGKGRLTGFSDTINSSTVAYTYDQKGRITRESRYVPQYGQTFVTMYSYDSFGRLSSMTYPSGRVINYTRDGLGRISQITTLAPGGSIQTVVSGVTYQPFGPTKGWTFGNGATFSRSFDLDGRISGYSLANLSRSLSYDAASRITAYAHNNAIYNQSFGYDNLNRVTSWATASTNQSYGYDMNGNRTSITYGANTYTYSYPSTSNRLMSVTGPTPQTYQYDAAGNVTSDGSRSYMFYGSGAMGSAVTAQDYFWYLPDAVQQRVSGESIYTSDGALFVRNKDGRLIAENPLYWNTSAVTEYIYLNDIPVAVATSPTNLYYIYPDHLDTPRIIVNPANVIVWRWDGSDPFGALPADNNPGGLGAFTFNLRFPGQYFSQETGLHYNYYRDYDPQTGRYIESDPIGLTGSLNTYAYVFGNPTARIDSLGLYGYGNIIDMWNHYCSGEGSSTATSFGSINWGDTSDRTISRVRALVGSDCTERTIPVSFNLGAQTAGADRWIIGRHVVRAGGSIKVHCDCTWTFEGTLSSALGYDPYDFDASNRGFIGEAFTWIGGQRCPNTGKPFMIFLTGQTSLSAGGTIAGTPTCCRQ